MGRKKHSGLSEAKNLVRPFLNDIRSKPFDPVRTFRQSKPFGSNLQQIRKIITSSNAGSILSFVEDNRLLPFDGLGNLFPHDRRRTPDSRLTALTPLDWRQELKLAGARIKHHQARLTKSITSLRSIDEKIEEGNLDKAIIEINEHTENYGISFAILKRSFLARYLQGGLPALPKEYKSQIDADHHLVWNIIAHLYYDLCDPSFSVDRSVSAWLRSLSPLQKKSIWYFSIFHWELSGECYTESSLAECILRYSSTSILDLTMFLWQAQNLNDNSSLFDRGQVRDELERCFSTSEILNTTAYKDHNKRISDIDIYRLTFFLRDYSNLSKIHNSISSPLFLSRMDGEYVGDDREITLISVGQSLTANKSIAALDEGISKWLIDNNISRASISSATFIKSLAIAHFVKVSTFGFDISERAYCSFICEGEGYHEHLTASLLRRRVVEAEAADHALLSFVIREAIYKKTRSADDDLERRAAFMAMFPPRKPEKIISKIRDIQSWSSTTAIFVARTCTRSFLERLFLIMTSLKDVLEVRLVIIEWLIENDVPNSNIYGDERKAVASELENLAVRSDLDSTRVHVDGDALREWFVEHQLPLVGRYIQTVLSEGPTHDREAFLAIHSRKIEAQKQEADEAFLNNIQIGSEFILLSIVEATLKAFVSDRIFGLDAYLSRRIRHGTLSGFLLTPVGKVVFSEDASDQASGGPIIANIDDKFVRDWHADITATLDHARKEIIQVQSDEHVEGLIEATWRSMSGVVHLDAVFSKVRLQILRTNGKYDPFEDIYALCWDLIERDLAKIRMFLLQDFLKSSLDSLDDGFRGLPISKQIAVFGKVTDAKEVLKSRVQEVCSWFIRPVFRQDSYNILNLVRSVVSIVRELDDKVVFNEVYEIEDGLEISRGAFEIAGDVLFVIIGNAAKHGGVGGNLEVKAIEVADPVPAVSVTVNSYSSDDAQFQEATARIRMANTYTSMEELEDASVQEGFSGIRKVILTLNRVSKGLARGQYRLDASKRQISFVFVIPREILFRRSR